MKYIFGPVPSRRLGRSLGVDLAPFKTCSYDCIYCQLGRTTNKTIERREWVPLDGILAELVENLETKPDYITLAGSGEPTLYSRIGELINDIHKMTSVPIAVLTNGSLLWLPEVRTQIRNADLIVPSLDAGDETTFEAVNRPHPSINFEQMLEGLIAMKQESPAAYWLEVFISGNYTSEDSQARKIAAHVAKIKPDKVQLNTVTRPPAEDYAVGVDRTRLEEIAAMFSPQAEIIADFTSVHAAADFSVTREAVAALLGRRPCSLDDISNGLGVHRNEMVKHLEKLLADNTIERIRVNGKTFYRQTSQ